MDFDNIKELIKTLSESSLTTLEIEEDGFKIKLKKEKEKVIVNEGVRAKEPSTLSAEDTVTVYDMHKNDKENNQVQQSKVEDKCITINSPIVGTFYEASSPTTEAFVKKGSKVKKGDTICIVEAMKLMNDIEAEFDMEILEVLVENEGMVEYNQPLFKVAKL
ncbi:acetyl-CoA carboxylase biotin carboxyl carrier protein [Clostridium sp. DL1XJH146]